MFILKKVFIFDAAHRLMNHRGRCRNLHGHTYKVVFSLIGKELDPDSDMLMDFGDISTSVKDYIDDHFDHALILNIEDEDLVQKLKPFGFRILTVPGEATAENISKWLYEHFQPIFSAKDLGISIEVWETPTSSAEYHNVPSEDSETPETEEGF